MNPNDIMLVIVSGLGVIHGLFLALFLWSFQKGHSLSNKLLSLLLVALSLRVGKSVFLEFTIDLDTKIIFTGLSILMVIGPLFYGFVRSCTSKSFKPTSKHLLHFIPAIAGFIFGLWVNDSHLQELPIQLFAFLFLFYYFHLLTYLIISQVHNAKQLKAGLDPEIYKFLRMLFIGLILIWAAYVFNLFEDVIPYIIGPILYSIVAYVLSFIVFQKGYIQKIHQSKYQTTRVSEEQQKEIYERAIYLIESEGSFTNPDISLKSLSSSLKVSTQTLSMVINSRSGKNFHSLINSYRIQQAINLFGNKNFEHMTLAAIAFEVGFNSISSFNTAFKKETGKTPQEYRNQLSE